MSSNQAPKNFQIHNASGYQNNVGDVAEPHQRAQNGSLATPPQLNDHPHISQSQFTDFSFSYRGLDDNGMLSESKVDSSSDPYGFTGHGSVPDHRLSVSSVHQGHRNSVTSVPGDHRASITSMPPVSRASFSGPIGQAGGNASVSGGSDEASPSSMRVGGGLDGVYNDEYGLNNASAIDGSDLGGRTREEKNDPNPPWSELKTKAGKERKRLPLACIACRRKKIRCSGEKPACKHCIRSRIPCVYKVTTRKAAPRTDYMAMLDRRLKRMEERIIKIVPKEEQDVTAISVTRANVKPAVPGSVPARNASGKKRPAEEAFGPELDSWSRSMAPSNPNDESKSASLLRQESEENKLLSEGLEALPSKDIQEHLSEIFFENVYGQTYYLLHKPSFMRKLRAGTLPPVLILAVCAVSARFSTHPKLNTTPNFLRGEEWASEARDIVMRRYEWPNITILTCFIILGLHEFGTCQGGRSWSFGGQAIRMAYALQLHLDLDYDPQKRNGTVELSFIDREIRRRTMWACFMMDRFNSSGTDRPTFIKEESIKVQLPIKEKFFQLDMPGPTENLKGDVPHPISPGAGQLSNPQENMGVAAYMIRSIALWGRIINYLNLWGKEEDPHPLWHAESGYMKLMEQTEAFNATIPDSLRYTKENFHTHETDGLANHFLFLHISVQQNVLFLNRFAIPGQPGGRPSFDTPKDFVTQAGGKAFRAANNISELLRDGESQFITAPFTGYCAFLSSTVHVFGVFSKNPSMEATSKKNLAINVKYLSKMKKYWGMFHFMSENLKEQYRICADAARKGPSANSSNVSASIFQYGDWFNRYPYGVSQSDFEDPAIGIKKEKGDDAVLEDKSDYQTVESFFHTLEPTTPQDREPTKSAKRKAKKNAFSAPGHPEAVNTNLTDVGPGPGTESAIQMGATNQIAQGYNQMSPTTPVNIYHNQTPYYGQNAMFPHQQGMLPQLDRQLVFGAYAGMDPSSLSTHSMLDGAHAWDMQMGGMSDFSNESSSAWFMPFNLEAPPDLGLDQDIFNTMGGNAGYAMGGVNNGNMNNHGAGS